MEKIKVYIVDDHEMFREGVKMLLSKSSEFEVIGEAQNGKQCVEGLPAETDIILMDISMPEMNGIEATQIIHGKSPSSKIIALSMFGEEEYYYKMIHAGVSGFVLKEAGSKEMEEAIREVYNGGNFFSKELLRNVVVGLSEHSSIEQELTSSNLFGDAERNVLKLLCEGLLEEEIASRLKIDVNDVKEYKKEILNKSGTKDTVGLIMYALKNNYVQFSATHTQ